MNQPPLINILIRTCGRESLFKRCVASIEKQVYKNVNLIVSVDRPCSYIPEGVEVVNVTPGKTKFFWNLYCNELKAQVKEGWFFYLDDDDYIQDKFALQLIAKYLTDPPQGIICQFIRWGKRKPNNAFMRMKRISRGNIGMPCIFLHESQKDVAMFDGEQAADFRFITDVSKKIPLKFVSVPVVCTDRIGRGKTEVIV